MPRVARRRDGDAPEPPPRRRVQVVVLGDFGRSPRMQYHAISLASSANLSVDVVAYAGTAARIEVTSHPNVTMRLIAPPPAWTRTRSRLVPLRVVALAMRVAFQIAQLLITMLWRAPSPDYVLLQTPPCVPSFAVCALVAFLRRAVFVVDWHNTAHSLMALEFGTTHPLVRIARWYERVAGSTLPRAHLCVSDAFRVHLESEFGIRGAVVLYDRAPAFFKRTSVEDAHALFVRAARAIDASAAAAPDDFVSIAGGLAPSDDRTLFTRRVCCAAGAATRGGGGGGKVLKDRRSPRERGRTGTSVKIERASGRPALLVSGTSWTKDEDFGVLLDALAMYDEIARADAEELLAGGRGGELLSRGREGGDRGRGKSAPRGGNQKDENETRRKRRLYPDVVAIVTGKGPGRDAYERRMASLRLTHVAIRTAWLPIEDYPTLLGAADLGVCLHASSGGVDLPMKVVDAFGCGLPVVAARYDALSELVVEEDSVEAVIEGVEPNGVTFEDAEELCARLTETLRGWWDGGDDDNGDGGGDDDSGDDDDDREGDHGATGLKRLRRGALAAMRAERWDENWDRVAKPLFE